MYTKKHKILIVCGFFPYPPMHGGMIDVWKRIEEIKSLGHTIDLVYTTKEKPIETQLNFVKKYVKNLFETSRKNRLIDIFNKLPIQVTSRRELQYISVNNTYDFVILEGDYVGKILENSSVIYRQLIIRSHNDEAWYFRNLCQSTRNFLKKSYYWIEFLKFKSYSKTLYSKANKVWYISKNEAFRSKLIGQKIVYMPPPFSLKEFKKQDLTSKNVLFIGSLFMDNNMEGILWYIKNVHYQIKSHEKNYKLIIVGNSGSRDKRKIKKRFKGHTDIEIHFNVSSLEVFYRKSSVFINPMFHGAGVKIKSVQAVINGLPLVSTSKGVEGIGFEKNKDFLQADTSRTFIFKILKLFKEKNKGQEMVENAQQFLKAHHFSKKLIHELNGLKKNI